MRRKRVPKMIIGFLVFAAVLLLLILFVFPPSKGIISQFCNENGEVIENSIAEKCYLEVEDGNLGMIIMAKDISNPVLLVCGGGPGIPEYLLEYMYPSDLADKFVVCYLEYRGTGLSYSSDIGLSPAVSLESPSYCWLLRVRVALVAGLNPTSHDTS